MSSQDRGRERNRATVRIPDTGQRDGHSFPEPSAQPSPGGRSPSPHLRGNPRLAAQMRSELLHQANSTAGSLGAKVTQSHAVQHLGPLGAEPAARRAFVSPEKRREMEQMLETMGFTDKAVNAAMMQKHNYQLDKVLDDLIASIGSTSTPGASSTRRADASGPSSSPPAPFGVAGDRRAATPPRSSTLPRNLQSPPRRNVRTEHQGVQSLDFAQLLGFTCIEGANARSPTIARWLRVCSRLLIVAPPQQPQTCFPSAHCLQQRTSY